MCAKQILLYNIQHCFQLTENQNAVLADQLLFLGSVVHGGGGRVAASLLLLLSDAAVQQQLLQSGQLGTMFNILQSCLLLL